MKWEDYAPFTDAKSAIRLTLGVVIVLLVLKLTGLKKYTG